MNRETVSVSPTPSPSQHVGETLAVSLPVPTLDDSKRTPTSVGTNVSFADPSIGNEDETIQQTIIDQQPSHERQEDTLSVSEQIAFEPTIEVAILPVAESTIEQEHHGQTEQPSTPKTRPQPKRGRIVERPTPVEESRPVPPASKATLHTPLSKNANMYRTSDTNAPQAQSTKADDLFVPRTTENRSPQAWAARLFKTAQPERTQNEPSTPVAPVVDSAVKKHEQQLASENNVIMRVDEVGTDLSRPGLGSIADRESKNPTDRKSNTPTDRKSNTPTDRKSNTPTDRELKTPTDAHEGLPYYTERASRVHPSYSRVAPRGRPLESEHPLESPERSLELPERTRFVAPLSQNSVSTPIQLSQHARAFLRPRVGIDPSDVSIYQDTAAAQVTDMLNADAVTLSADTIALAPDLPDTPATLGLLAHELTHVARRQASRFVPPIVKSSPSVTNVLPIVENENNLLADEETIAECVEQAVIEAAQGQHDPTHARQELRPNGTAEALKNAQVSSAENILWGELPAPWEPLPDWLVVPPEDTPTTTRNSNAQWVAQAPLYQVSEGGQFGNSEFVHTTQVLNNDTIAEDIQRAGRERTLEQEDVATSSALPSAQSPEPDLDVLAKQVYSVLKRRLEAEYRRIQ